MHQLSQNTSRQLVKTLYGTTLRHLAKGRRRSDTHCKIKETLLIGELKPTLNDNVSSERFTRFFFRV